MSETAQSSEREYLVLTLPVTKDFARIGENVEDPALSPGDRDRFFRLGMVRMEQFTDPKYVSTERPSYNEIMQDFRDAKFTIKYFTLKDPLPEPYKTAMQVTDPDAKLSPMVTSILMIDEQGRPLPDQEKNEVWVFEGMEYESLLHEWTHLKQLQLVRQPKTQKIPFSQPPEIMTFQFQHFARVREVTRTEGDREIKNYEYAENDNVLSEAYQVFLEYHNRLWDFYRTIQNMNFDDDIEYTKDYERLQRMTDKEHDGFLWAEEKYNEQTDKTVVFNTWLAAYFGQPQEGFSMSFNDLEDYCLQFIDDSDTGKKKLLPPEKVKEQKLKAGK